MHQIYFHKLVQSQLLLKEGIFNINLMQKESPPKQTQLKLIQDQKTIKFYGKNQKYGFMSNFYPSPFMEGKRIYSTNQHYFQSKKFEGLPQQQLVISAKTPSQAFYLGRNKKFPKRPDWQQVKEKIMYKGLRLKFDTHKQLKAQLMDTKDKILVEHTFKDRYWADGGDGSGKNRLGVLLMKLRQQYRKK